MEQSLSMSFKSLSNNAISRTQGIYEIPSEKISELETTYGKNIDNYVAKFIVKATGKGLHYQWKVQLPDSNDYINILDNNCSELIISNYTNSAYMLNGAKFKCIVSNSKGSIESSEAILTINEIVDAPVITSITISSDIEPAEYDKLVQRKFAEYVVLI